MGTKTVTREYPSLPGSDAYTETVFVAIDATGQPELEEIAFIDCPDCDTKLKITQHAATADGLPHVMCGADCPGGPTLTVVDYDE